MRHKGEGREECLGDDGCTVRSVSEGGLWGEGEVYDRVTRRLIASYIEQNKTGTKMRGGYLHRPDALRERRAASAAEADPDLLSRQGKLGDVGTHRECSLFLSGSAGAGVGGISSTFSSLVNGLRRFSLLSGKERPPLGYGDSSRTSIFPATDGCGFTELSQGMFLLMAADIFLTHCVVVECCSVL